MITDKNTAVADGEVVVVAVDASAVAVAAAA